MISPNPFRFHRFVKPFSIRWTSKTWWLLYTTKFLSLSLFKVLFVRRRFFLTIDTSTGLARACVTSWLVSYCIRLLVRLLNLLGLNLDVGIACCDLHALIIKSAEIWRGIKLVSVDMKFLFDTLITLSLLKRAGLLKTLNVTVLSLSVLSTYIDIAWTTAIRAGIIWRWKNAILPLLSSTCLHLKLFLNTFRFLFTLLLSSFRGWLHCLSLTALFGSVRFLEFTVWAQHWIRKWSLGHYVRLAKHRFGLNLVRDLSRHVFARLHWALWPASTLLTFLLTIYPTVFKLFV